MVDGKPEVGNEASDEEDCPTDIVSCAEAAAALDTVLRLVEQHSSATPSDVMFMRRWLSIASAGRMTALRQMKMTDFISS